MKIEEGTFKGTNNHTPLVMCLFDFGVAYRPIKKAASNFMLHYLYNSIPPLPFLIKKKITIKSAF